MTVPTPPAVSDAMREAVAREIDPAAWARVDRITLCRQVGHEVTYGEVDQAVSGTKTSLRKAKAILAGPIVSEIARLTGENLNLRHQDADTLQALCTAEAETARLRAALDDAADALGWAASALREDENDAAAGVTLSAANNASAALSSQEKTDA